MEDVLKVQQVIARFANSFDVKDWDGLQSCFTDEIHTDYPDRGEPLQTVSAADYVKARRESLKHLKLHHLVSNYEIEILNLDTAACRASMVVWRRSNEEEVASHCRYDFRLARRKDEWKISGITQTVLWNERTSSAREGAQREGS